VDKKYHLENDPVASETIHTVTLCDRVCVDEPTGQLNRIANNLKRNSRAVTTISGKNGQTYTSFTSIGPELRCRWRKENDFNIKIQMFKRHRAEYQY
jgi:hypothetical protein